MVPVQTTLNKHFVFSITLPLGLVFLALLVFANQSLKKISKQQQEEVLKEHIDHMQFKFSEQLSIADLGKVQALINNYADNFQLHIFLATIDGNVVFASHDKLDMIKQNILDHSEVSQALHNQASFTIHHDKVENKDYLNSASLFKDSLGKPWLLRASLQLNDYFYYQRFMIFLSAAFFGILIATQILLLLSTYKIKRSLINMRRPITAFIHGTFDKQIKENSSIAIEVSRLERSINKLSRSLLRRADKDEKNRIERNSILSTMKEGIITTAEDQTITHINKSAIKLLKISEENLVGRNIVEVIRNPQLLDIIEETKQKKSAFKRDIHIIESDKTLDIQVRASSLLNEDGVVLGTLLVLNNITEFIKLEQNRKDFIANVSHELKTPLTAINGYVETLLGGALSDPEVNTKFLQKILKHGQRLTEIIDDLLDLAKFDQQHGRNRKNIQLSPYSLNKCLKSALDSLDELIRQKDLKINFYTEREIAIPMQSSLLEQAFKNIVENAIKYSAQKTLIEVTLTSDENRIFVKIRDQGRGIEKQHLNRIFERFYRVDAGRSRAEGGSGLGLSLVKHIILIHHGVIEVDSEVNKGSCFTISWPNTIE
ncbi:MAG: PAS domain-containing protein [Oligoflexales bacterium]|nr:PAS domain-containing protein [Oligoflexales bacterium]